MILQELADGRLWCINQTAHTQMSVELCRYWGNGDFAPLVAGGPTLLAVAQHDNGWWEWEQAPELGADGTPLDFLNGPDWQTRLGQWQRGIDRCFAQHPYAGVLTGAHAAALYERYLVSVAVAPAENAALGAFIADQARLVREARRLLPGYHGLDDEALGANTRMVQFGDLAALLVTVPWPSGHRIKVPTDARGGVTEVTLTYDEAHICLDPWPYSQAGFTVSVWGRLLNERRFDDDARYHQALAAAAPRWQEWRVSPA